MLAARQLCLHEHAALADVIGGEAIGEREQAGEGDAVRLPQLLDLGAGLVGVVVVWLIGAGITTLMK